jgi:hypothetical protein
MTTFRAFAICISVFFACGYLADAQGQNYLKDSAGRSLEQPAEASQAPVVAAPEAAPAVPVSSESQVAIMTPNREHWFFELGTRITYYKLIEDERGADGGETFLGQISNLDAEQDYAPYKLFADVMYNKYVGAEITWDKVSAATINRGGSTDGDVTLMGPIFSLIGRYPNDTIFTPYAGIGVAFLSGSFDEVDWWHYGWASEADYVAAGSPATYRHKKSRRIVVDDVTAFPISMGCAIKVAGGWSADLYFRYMQADADAEFLENERVLGTGSFAMGNYAFGIGAKYVF